MNHDIALFLHEKLNMFIFLFVVVILDLLGGILVSIKKKEFKWEMVPEFLQDLGLYLLMWFAAELIGFLPIYLDLSIPGLEELLSQVGGFSGLTVYSLLILKYVASILSKFVELGIVGGSLKEFMQRAGLG